MCRVHVYTQIDSRGFPERRSSKELCDRARLGQSCDEQQFIHPSAEPMGPYAHNVFPPTPPLSSHSASGSGSDHSSRRRSRSGVYIKGQKVLDINQKRSSRREKADRVVYVESPPLSRTPPRQFTLPRSMPSSPTAESYEYDTYEPRYRETVVDEREYLPRTSRKPPTVKVEVVNNSSSSNKSHRRHGSKTSSSRDSGSSSDEERKRQRRASVAAAAALDDEAEFDRQLRINAEIAEQNKIIASRPPVVPMPPTTSTPRYRRGSVVVDRTEPLAAAMGQLALDREQQAKAQRRREKRAAEARELRQRDEEEMQRQRLMERLTPQRRATIGAGQRRQKVVYENGLYRLE
ncbi:hypothetical protein GGR56DRAFT_287451 [Xylariaceae sp. FL0804]|nr:hypothetical protein GGR56DRAFT_287451 [Xylariaceae sp. FL0804]